MVSKVAKVGDDKPGSSMIEQLVAEVTCYALSSLDYSSVCQLSMTSSSMRKAANDDKLWKSLYHQEFTEEQVVNVNPVNGWKAYYAATKAVMNLNYEFFTIIGSRSLNRMTSFWLNSDYVKCFNVSGELFSGYDAVMGRWEFCFNNWEVGFDLEALDVQVRILTSLAWVNTLITSGTNAVIECENEWRRGGPIQKSPFTLYNMNVFNFSGILLLILQKLPR